MTGTKHIGKESHDWERQAVLGLSLDSEVSYGVSTTDLAAKLRSFVTEFGEAKAAKALRLSNVRLGKLVSGQPSSRLDNLMRMIGARLPLALKYCAQYRDSRQEEFRRLSGEIERDGLRETARRLEIDPSNLSRKLRQLCPAFSVHKGPEV